MCCVFRPAFGCLFQWFHSWNQHWKSFEMNKKGWKMAVKMYQPALGCVQHPKAGQNTQQLCILWLICAKLS